MLSYSLKGDILEVKQTTFSFSKDRNEFWYYDISKWMKSSYGKQNDVPDRNMTQSDIDWVCKYYLPKVNASLSLTQEN